MNLLRNAFPNREEITRMKDFDRHDEIERDVIAALSAMPPRERLDVAAADVGQLSAEAIKAQYEAGAAALEQMSSDLLERLKQTEADTLDVVRSQEALRAQITSVVEQCQKAAAGYRQEADDQAKNIKAVSDLAERVRKTCEELSASILGGGQANG